MTGAADQAQDEAGFFARLREAGVLVRVRFSETNPGQVTGYAVSLPGHDGSDGQPLWYGGGRLSADLTLPRLRRHWDPPRSSAAEQPGAFRFTAPERDAIYAHAARQAAAAAEHIRRCAEGDPAQAADAAWAAADTLHVAARALRNPELRRAADSYGRAGRARYGQIPGATREGNQLRTAARLMALTGRTTGDTTLVTMALIANLAALAIAVAELREASSLPRRQRQPAPPLRTCRRLTVVFVHLCRTRSGRKLADLGGGQVLRISPAVTSLCQLSQAIRPLTQAWPGRARAADLRRPGAVDQAADLGEATTRVLSLIAGDAHEAFAGVTARDTAT